MTKSSPSSKCLWGVATPASLSCFRISGNRAGSALLSSTESSAGRSVTSQVCSVLSPALSKHAACLLPSLPPHFWDSFGNPSTSGSVLKELVGRIASRAWERRNGTCCLFCSSQLWPLQSSHQRLVFTRCQVLCKAQSTHIPPPPSSSPPLRERGWERGKQRMIITRETETKAENLNCGPGPELAGYKAVGLVGAQSCSFISRVQGMKEA